MNIAGGLFFLAAIAAPATVLAQAYPVKPVRLVVGPAGPSRSAGAAGERAHEAVVEAQIRRVRRAHWVP